MPITWRRPTALEIVEFGGENLGFETMRVTSPFGDRPNPDFPRFSSKRTVLHDGLDIGNHRSGDQVVASADGRVIAEGALLHPWSDPAPAGSEWFGGNYGGLMVVIDHGSKTVSVYAHFRKTLVSAGDRVTAGKPIGEVGDTGSAKGQAHLHFGILVDGEPIDPWPQIIIGGLTREERLAREALALRAAHPADAARWVRNTGLSVEKDGKPIRREVRLAAEVTFLREVARNQPG
jgi:murein DD-endopeptidase MepM/ murein hydrolase activator NlpD